VDIRALNLKKSFFLEGKEIPVLGGIDLHIRSGEFVTLTGASGVGKSTLLHLLGTLDSPSSGDIFHDDVNVFAKSHAQMSRFRNENIGFVFQFHHLLPEFSALENAAMPLLVSRMKRTEAFAKAAQWLVEVGLKERMEHKPGELSGGEQQRVALARALVNEPKILLADEPTGNLDEKTGSSIVDIIKKVNAERGITALVVTHNPRLAEQAPRQLEMRKDGVFEANVEPSVSRHPGLDPGSQVKAVGEIPGQARDDR